MFYIYMIFNLVNGKIYVGQTHNPNRWQEHLYISTRPAYSKHKLIHKAIAKYGKDNFTFTIIQYLKSKEESLACEKYWIDFYQSNICRFPKALGYNLTDGGESSFGLKWSQASKDNLSKLLRGNMNNAAILTPDQVIHIAALINQNVSCVDISKQYNVSKRTINNIRLGKRWAHLTKNIIDFDKIKHGNLGRSAKGKAKLNLSQVKEIKDLLKSQVTLTDISKRFGISYKVAHDIKTGKSWKHVT